MMKRRSFMAWTAAVVLTATPAVAQGLSLDQVSAYLNGLQTAQGGFTQINADGTLSTGQIYIKRPGRIRFEYNAADNSLVMAGGGQVAIFDPRSNNGPDRYPLNQTPLKIILERNVDLARASMVMGHTSDGTTTTVTAQDPAHPQYGNIQMVFTANPVELRQWIVTDEVGSQTTMILNDLVRGGRINDIKFNIAMRRKIGIIEPVRIKKGRLTEAPFFAKFCDKIVAARRTLPHVRRLHLRYGQANFCFSTCRAYIRSGHRDRLGTDCGCRSLPSRLRLWSATCTTP